MGFSYFLAAKQKQLPEAFRLLAKVLWDGHESVRQKGQRSSSGLLLSACQRFIVKINQVGFVGTLARKPDGAMLLQQEVSDVCADDSLRKQEDNGESVI